MNKQLRLLTTNVVMRKTVYTIIVFTALLCFFYGLAHNPVVIDLYKALRVHLGFLGFKPAKLWVIQREIMQYAPILVLSIVVVWNKRK